MCPYLFHFKEVEIFLLRHCPNMLTSQGLSAVEKMFWKCCQPKLISLAPVLHKKASVFHTLLCTFIQKPVLIMKKGSYSLCSRTEFTSCIRVLQRSNKREIKEKLAYSSPCSWEGEILRAGWQSRVAGKTSVWSRKVEFFAGKPRFSLLTAFSWLDEATSHYQWQSLHKVSWW